MKLCSNMYISDLEGSASLEVVNLVLQMQAKGEKITSLAIGEPMYKTPDDIIEVAYNSMLNGDTHYTSSYGIYEVRNAIVDKVRKKNGIKASIEETIFITSKQSIYASLMAIAGKRSKVLVPNPGYFYREPAMIAGFKVVPYTLNEDFSLNIDDIKNKADQDTAAIIINSPGNPTGKVFRRQEIEQVYEICSSKGIKLISDEAYEDLVYENAHFSVGSLEDSPENVISIFSLSKSYSMTGWRAGYTVANSTIVRNIARVIEHTYTCSPPFIQKASAYAIKNGTKYIKKFKKDFLEKRNYVLKRIGEIEELQLDNIEGAFYAFPTYKKNVRSSEFSKGLLTKYATAVLPGSAFGSAGEKHIRISFSGSMESIVHGLDEIEKYLRE